MTHIFDLINRDYLFRMVLPSFWGLRPYCYGHFEITEAASQSP